MPNVEESLKLVQDYHRYRGGVGPIVHLSDLRLEGAKLSGLDLCGARLYRSFLVQCSLCNVRLRGAILAYANLTNCELTNADLFGANLTCTNLAFSDLRGANLQNANLWATNFHKAKLGNTVLDPNNTTNWGCGDFQETVPGTSYVFGYRSRAAGHIEEYVDGRVYNADWFSTCDTDCHPGLYLWPTLERAEAWTLHPFLDDYRLIKVKTSVYDIHKAGNKYRCRWFEVVGEVT